MATDEHEYERALHIAAENVVNEYIDRVPGYLLPLQGYVMKVQLLVLSYYLADSYSRFLQPVDSEF